MPIAEIAGGACERRRWGVSVDTTVILRAVATVLIVGSHVELFDLTGGAHLLLLLAGYNLARFHLAGGGGPSVGGLTSSRTGWALAAIALPTSLWIGAMAAPTGESTGRASGRDRVRQDM